MKPHNEWVCKVCSAPAVFICRTINTHSTTEELSHCRCTNCGLVFVGNKIDDAELGEAYASIDMTGYYEETETEARRKLDRSSAELAESLPDKNARIVDIGTGNGWFLQTLSKAGFANLSCHELPGAKVSHLKDNGFVVFQDFDFGSLPDSAFDAVTHLDVAEHVRDPWALFMACARTLKPGGLLYLHTPTTTRLDRFMQGLCSIKGVARIGSAWQRGRTSIFHLQIYTRKSLHLILTKLGFTDIRIEARNELSWPLQRYVRVYFTERLRLPSFLARFLAPFFYPFLATRFFNANKAVVWARKPAARS